jgi:hypothetical protein
MSTVINNCAATGKPSDCISGTFCACNRSPTGLSMKGIIGHIPIVLPRPSKKCDLFPRRCKNFGEFLMIGRT